jgi:hypothetical protein
VGEARAAVRAGGGGGDRRVGGAGAPPAAAVRVQHAARERGAARARAVSSAGGAAARRTHHVFLCDSPALFALFATPWHRNVGGVTHVYLGGNAFLRPFSIERGRLIGPSGDDKPGERTLAYFIAHEVTHAMTGDHVGRRRYRGLAAFQQEGYADYVAFARPPPFDLAGGRQALERDAPEMDVRRSGLYRRYELMVAYLLERRGLTVDQLLAARIDPAATLAALRADASIAEDPSP